MNAERCLILWDGDREKGWNRLSGFNRAFVSSCTWGAELEAFRMSPRVLKATLWPKCPLIDLPGSAALETDSFRSRGDTVQFNRN